MAGDLENMVALGVRNPEEAATFYEGILGYRRVRTHDDYVEMLAGGVRVFLTQKEVTAPVFQILTEDISRTMRYLYTHGFKRHVDDAADTRTFLRDPFGHIYQLVEE